MSSNTNGVRKLRIALAMAVLWSMAGGWVGLAKAQTARVSGEISGVRAAKVNGLSAISGGTVFDRSRVETGKGGGAILNLGKRGRIEIGGETALTLGLTPVSVGGDLRAGSASLSIPAGMSLYLTTEKGVISSDGRELVMLHVDSVGKLNVITVRIGEVRVVSSGRSETLAAGDSVTLNGDSGEWARRRTVAPAATMARAASGSAVPAGSQAAFSVKTSTMSELLNASINYSIIAVTQRSRRDPESFFSNSFTCRDTDSVFCVRRSGVTP